MEANYYFLLFCHLKIAKLQAEILKRFKLNRFFIDFRAFLSNILTMRTRMILDDECVNSDLDSIYRWSVDTLKEFWILSVLAI
jgi:hypothetical protein